MAGTHIEPYKHARPTPLKGVHSGYISFMSISWEKLLPTLNPHKVVLFLFAVVCACELVCAMCCLCICFSCQCHVVLCVFPMYAFLCACVRKLAMFISPSYLRLINILIYSCVYVQIKSRPKPGGGVLSFSHSNKKQKMKIDLRNIAINERLAHVSVFVFYFFYFCKCISYIKYRLQTTRLKRGKVGSHSLMRETQKGV